MLPWAKPIGYSSGFSTETGKHNPPEKNTLIKVFINEYWTHFYYVFDEQLEDVNVYEHWTAVAGDIDELGESTYPNPRFQKLLDGSIMFYDSEKGIIGIYHKSGTYRVINEKGEIVEDVNGTKLRIKDGEIHLAGDADWLVTWTDLQNVLNGLANALTSHPHADPISGSTGPPNTAFSINIDGAKADKVKTS